jgi:hypothetical protein
MKTAIPMHHIQGLGCYTGLPHPRASATCLFIHDDHGNLVWQKDREKSYQGTLPYGFVERTPVAHPMQPI